MMNGKKMIALGHRAPLVIDSGGIPGDSGGLIPFGLMYIPQDAGGAPVGSTNVIPFGLTVIPQ